MHRCCLLAKQPVQQLQIHSWAQDVDCSGDVNFEEFVAGVLEDGDLLTSSKLHVAFDFLDKDQNGMVDLGTLQAVQQQHALISGSIRALSASQQLAAHSCTCCCWWTLQPTMPAEAGA